MSICRAPPLRPRNKCRKRDCGCDSSENAVENKVIKRKINKIFLIDMINFGVEFGNAVENESQSGEIELGRDSSAFML